MLQHGPKSRMGRFPIQFLAITLVVVSMAAPVVAQEPHGVTMDHILGVWRARQERVKSLRIEVDDWHTTGRMTLEGGNPPEDVTHLRKQTFVIDGDRMSLVIDGPRWRDTLQEFIPMYYRSVWSNGVAKSVYLVEKNTDASFNMGFIGTREHHFEYDNRDYIPILFHFRPLPPGLGYFNVQEWIVLPEQEVVGSRPCVVIERVPKRPLPYRHRFWLDREREFSALRYRAPNSLTGVMEGQVDAEYKLDPSYGWVPDRWQVIVTPGERLIASKVMEVTSYTINPRVDDSVFELVFERGTVVSDYDERLAYVVKPDGTKRIITGGEFQRETTYRDWLKTESGQAGLPSRRTSWTRYVWLGSLSVAIAALAAYVAIKWRRYRRSRFGTM